MNESTRSEAFCESEFTAAGSVTSTFDRTTNELKNGTTLITESLIELSIGGGSDCEGVSMRTEDTSTST